MRTWSPSSPAQSRTASAAPPPPAPPRPAPARERRPHGPLRIVAVRRRRSEDAHHRVAHELLDHAPEPLDLRPDPLVVRRQDRANVLRIEPLRAGSEPDEGDEQHRDDAPLLARAAGLDECGAARVAEPGALRIFLATACASR